MDFRGASPAWMLGWAQAVTTAVAVMVAWWLGGKPSAVASLFGGMVAFIPATYFSVRTGMRRGEAEAKQVLGNFYRAELGKLLLTALLFFIGALVFGKHFAALMLTCVACLAMNWLVLALARSD